MGWAIKQKAKLWLDGLICLVLSLSHAKAGPDEWQPALIFVFLAPASQAGYPHNGNTDHPHYGGGAPSGDQSFCISMVGGDELTVSSVWLACWFMNALMSTAA